MPARDNVFSDLYPKQTASCTEWLINKCKLLLLSFGNTRSILMDPVHNDLQIFGRDSEISTKWKYKRA